MEKKKQNYSVRVRLWTETNRGGNMSEYYFGWFKKNGEPKLVGVEKRKTWEKFMFADYICYKLKDWLNGQLWIGDYEVEIIK